MMGLNIKHSGTSSFSMSLPQVELADKRAPLETRKRKGAAAPEEDSQQQQQQAVAVTQKMRRQQDAAATAPPSTELSGTAVSPQDHTRAAEAVAGVRKRAKSKHAAPEGTADEASGAVVSVQDASAGDHVLVTKATGKRKHVQKDVPDITSVKHRLLRAIALGNLNAAVAPAAIALAQKLGTVSAPPQQARLHVCVVSE
jgi:hypothetical protein